MSKGIFALAAGAVVVAMGLSAAYNFGTEDNVTFTVNDKDRITESSTDSDGNTSVSSKYIVFTDNETFENTDSFLRFKFNSSDVQGKLKEGHTYNCDVYGWRIPLLSNYRNIISCEEVPAGPSR